ncbi:MAG TPA: mechanosensitive ion channel domain-containing protein [Pirellulales bacterium]|nr:mechanosensitive ion channel domain-containing protein [Pirellulales bacterium]
MLRNAPRRYVNGLAVVLWTLACACGSAIGTAQEPQPSEEAPSASVISPVKPAETITTEAVQHQLEEAKTAKDLDDATKTELVKFYQQALAELDRAAASKAKTAEFVTASQQAPRLFKRIRAEMDAPPSTPSAIEVPPETTLAQLETSLAQAQADLSAAQDELTQLDAEPKRRAGRRLEIPKKREAADAALEDVRKQLGTPSAAEEPKPLADARHVALVARQAALEQALAQWTAERESYNAEDELLPRQRDLAERRVGEKKELVKNWQQILHDRRQQEAGERLKDAAEEKEHTDGRLRGVAEENEQLAQRATQIGNDASLVSQQVIDYRNAQEELERDFQGVTEKVDTLGLTQELGPYLLQFRLTLTRRRQELKSGRLPRPSIASVQVEELKLADQRKKLGDVPARAKEIVRKLDLSESRAPREGLDFEVRRLLEKRRDLLDALIAVYGRYTRELTELTVAQRRVFMELDQEADYIDERILWVRSAAALSTTDLSAAWEAVGRYAVGDVWVEVARQLLIGLWAERLATFAAFVVVAVLLAGQGRMRAAIRGLGERAVRSNAADMAPTLRVLVLSLLMAAPWPAALSYLGWALSRAGAATDLTKAVAVGLSFTAALLLPLELLRHVCRSKGLGQAHFGWPDASMRLFRKHLRWFMMMGLPLAFLAATVHTLENDRWRDSLGRLLFMAALLLLGVFNYRVARPMENLIREFLASKPGGWLERLHYVVAILVLGAPWALALLAGLGYYYTARQLAARLEDTGWLVVGFLLTGALAMRWLLVMRRRLAIRQAQLRRAAAAVEVAGCDGVELPGVSSAGEAAIDLMAMNLQTRHLVQTGVVLGFVVGLWLIWADVLPALSFLNMPLWQTTIDTAATVAADGAAVAGPLTRTVSINVSHLLLALLSLTISLIAARNIPGLLEIALLQRLPLEPATRYAITTLSRYVISVLGIVLACVTVGITWSKVHWLLAAVSVGLGFGLQEIFANFISGLIILFERPVRVGDVVTVGDVTGVVSRIRIRATMITDADRKELIMPNKEFITGRVLNWTLSDQINRVVINVGVAYGSDVERVREILLRLAKEERHVLDEPAPMATFEGFGDSTLNLVLRCYLPSLDDRLAVINDLHSRIHEVFQAEGIEMPFPQRDVHIHTAVAAALHTPPQALNRAG